MRRIKFIVNPISGKGRKWNLDNQLRTFAINNNYICDIEYSKHAGHGSVIAHEAVGNKFDTVVVIGGDGSVNDVAQSVIGSSVVLGIIPLGSGNGIARHFEIPCNIQKALEVIAEGKTTVIDTFSISKVSTTKANNSSVLIKYGIGFSGLGFDAFIGMKFNKAKIRGLAGYIYTIASNFFSYKADRFEITIEGEKRKLSCFILNISNTSQFGNNISIAPHADPKDGLLDLVILKKFPKWWALNALSKILSGNIVKSIYYQTHQFKNIRINQVSSALLHCDGETIQIEDEIIYQIHPNSLKLKVPQGKT